MFRETCESCFFSPSSSYSLLSFLLPFFLLPFFSTHCRVLFFVHFAFVTGVPGEISSLQTKRSARQIQNLFGCNGLDKKKWLNMRLKFSLSFYVFNTRFKSKMKKKDKNKVDELTNCSHRENTSENLTKTSSKEVLQFFRSSVESLTSCDDDSLWLSSLHCLLMMIVRDTKSFLRISSKFFLCLHS